MTDPEVARDVLIDGSRALAHEPGLDQILRALLETIARPFAVGSAAIAVHAAGSEDLRIVASLGLDEAAAAGLGPAIARPDHPVARTFTDPRPTFDVTPLNPGGPALRSHLPLIIHQAGEDRLLGVLALAYEPPIDPQARRVLIAVSDLMAVALERHRPPDELSRREPASPSGSIDR